jgi:sugar-specific transcriptional regulator TrmB
MTDFPQHDIQRFLYDFVESLEDLRVLAWFRGLERGAPRTASEVVEATGISDLIVGDVLDRLEAKYLLETTADAPVLFRYAPPTPEFSATLDAVLERYQENSMDVLRIMSANSIERVRAATLRTWDEAVRNRGPKRD